MISCKSEKIVRGNSQGITTSRSLGPGWGLVGHIPYKHPQELWPEYCEKPQKHQPDLRSQDQEELTTRQISERARHIKILIKDRCEDIYCV
jgi:hypothetical protein